MPAAGHFQVPAHQMVGLREVDVEIVAAKMRADNPTWFDDLANYDPTELAEIVTRQVRQQNMAREAEAEEEKPEGKGKGTKIAQLYHQHPQRVTYV